MKATLRFLSTKNTQWPARVKGTNDHFPDMCAKFSFLEERFQSVCRRYAFKEIRTPIIEHVSLFKRLGEETDIVRKEMYSLQEPDDEIVLRPENTASVIRAVSDLAQDSHRLFYKGPMFRRERPQKGRYRQFEQFGVEAIGKVENHAERDVELIELAARCLSEVGILHSVSLQINSLGDAASRKRYEHALKEYFAPKREQLSTFSQERFDRGAILRILDSKETQDIDLVRNAPLLADSLSDACQERFGNVKRGLEALNVQYVVMPLLVRGLDYYCHTIFEFVNKAHDGRQAAVLAGGRYDGLLSNGPSCAPVPAIGWAAGLDRLVSLMQEKPLVLSPGIVYVLVMSFEFRQFAMLIASKLRRSADELQVYIYFEGSVGKLVRKASMQGVRFCVLIGEDEMKQNSVSVKDLSTGAQSLVSHEMIVDHFHIMLKTAPVAAGSSRQAA